MKKLLSTLAIAAASTALAVESSNTFGILRVDSSAAQTIVSVPWLAAGGGDINVADVVKTANLNNGDKLHYYNTSEKKYRVWVLTDGAWVEAKDAQDPVVAAPTLARGDAIVLERFGTIGACFYLYGQYTTDDASTSCVANGYTLLAPPKTTADAKGNIDLNSESVKWSNITASDKIILPTGKMLDWNSTAEKWGTFGYSGPNDWTGTWSYDAANIPLGQGVWLKAGDGPDRSVTWK